MCLQDLVLFGGKRCFYDTMLFYLNSHIELVKDNYQLPSFRAHEGSEWHEKEWGKVHNYTADVPDPGKYAIANINIICIIDWDRHAWIDDKTGEIIQSVLINMEIQCLDKNLPHNQSSGSGKPPH